MRQINPPIKIINYIKHFITPRARVKVHGLYLYSYTYIHTYTIHEHAFLKALVNIVVDTVLANLYNYVQVDE